MPTTERFGTQPFSRILRWLLTVSAFFIFPYLLLSFGLGIIWRNTEKDATEKAFEVMDSTLGQLSKQAHFGFRLPTILRKINRIAGGGSQRQQRMAESLKDLQKRLPGLVQTYATDAQGEILEGVTQGNPPRAVVRKLHEYYQKVSRPRKEVMDARNQLWPLVQNFVGPGARITDLPTEILPGPLGYTRMFQAGYTREKYFFFIDYRSEGSFIAHISFPKDADSRMLKDLLPRLQRGLQAGGMEAGFDEATASVPADPALARALGDFHKLGVPHNGNETSIFAMQAWQGRGILWLQMKRSHIADFSRQRAWLLLLGSLGLFLFSRQSWRVMVLKESISFPIRRRLILLFLFAAGLPLTALVLSSLDYLHQKDRELLDQADKQTFETLRAFDKCYERQISIFEQEVDLLTPKIVAMAQDMNVPPEYLLRMGLPFGCKGLSMFDLQGNIQAMTPDAQFFFTTGSGRLIRRLSKVLLEELNQSADMKGVDPTAVLIDSMGAGGSFIQGLMRKLGQIQYLNISNEEGFLLLKPVRTTGPQYSHLFMLYWTKQQFLNHYLCTNLPVLQRGLPWSRVFGFFREARVFPEEAVYTAHPVLYRQGVVGLRNKMDFRLQSLSQRSIIEGQPVLFTGYRTQFVEGGTLICGQPEYLIIAETAYWKLFLVLFIGANLFLAFYLGNLLSEKFLTPISHLTAGVEAIHLRNFQHRLPPGENDELGHLAQTFNQVMVGMSDLDVGRIVQESFLPEIRVDLGEYRLFGKSLFATELSGDYFEIVSLPDGKRLLLLIGDVSGHGVGSALVMAMAKGLVLGDAERGTPPEEILANLHRLILKTVDRKKMLTCQIGILDSENHTLLIANAGHNYPCFLPANSSHREIAIPSMPLGVSKKPRLASRTIPFHPGDRLFLYTDGLVEADATGEMVGYDRLFTKVAGLKGSDPRLAWEELMAWHRTLTGDGPRQDDMSAILINRT